MIRMDSTSNSSFEKDVVSQCGCVLGPWTMCSGLGFESLSTCNAVWLTQGKVLLNMHETM